MKHYSKDLMKYICSKILLLNIELSISHLFVNCLINNKEVSNIMERILFQEIRIKHFKEIPTI